jgi:hypothetical protein
MCINNEHPDYPRFFIPVGNKDVIVSRTGEIINLRTGGTPAVIVRNHGYLSCNISYTSDGKKVEKQYLLHRMLALAFIEIPPELKDKPLSKIQVNHKDGDKLNNYFDNLEWMSAKHNMRHAFKTKLIDIALAVDARHVITNLVISFDSIRKCSDFFDIPPASLRRHLCSKHAGMITNGWHVFKYRTTKLWPAVEEFNKVESKWGFDKVTVAKNVASDEMFIFNCLKEACETLGFKYGDLKNYRSYHKGKNNHQMPFRGWVFFEHDSAAEIDIGNLKPPTIKKRYTDRVFDVVSLHASSPMRVVGLNKLAQTVDYAPGYLRARLKEGVVLFGPFLITECMDQQGLVHAKV